MDRWLLWCWIGFGLVAFAGCGGRQDAMRAPPSNEETGAVRPDDPPADPTPPEMGQPSVGREGGEDAPPNEQVESPNPPAMKSADPPAHLTDAEPRMAPSVQPALGGPAVDGSSFPDPGPLRQRPSPDQPESVRVYYATDRQKLAPSDQTVPWGRRFGFSIGVACLGAAWMALDRKRLISILGWVACFGVAGYLGLQAAQTTVQQHDRADRLAFEFGPDWGEGMQYGVCTVSMPPRHAPGEIETPALIRGELREDPDKHVILQAIESLDDSRLFGSLSRDATNAGRELLVFIHGYNVSFEHAVRRSAQLKYDLDYPGPVVCYSWPSRGEFAGYPEDKESVEWTDDHLADFLERLVDESASDENGDKYRINIVAHSMGNRALVFAMEKLADRIEPGRINQIVMAAPDVQARDFQENIAKTILPLAQRVTLYASSKDKALQASKTFNGKARVGDSGADLVVMPGMETVDATEIDTGYLGHSYYASKRELLFELHAVLVRRLPVQGRFWLEVGEKNGQDYWVFPRANIDQILK